MEKALEILKDVLINMDFLDDDGYHFGKYATMEAIAELEEAMYRTCEGCKYLYINEHDEWSDYCNELCIEISHSTINTFCCNRYEPKEQLC